MKTHKLLMSVTHSTKTNGRADFVLEPVEDFTVEELIYEIREWLEDEYENILIRNDSEDAL